LQSGVQAFHEFTEAGLFAASEAWHTASEPYSHDGVYGKWFAALTLAGCSLWLAVSLAASRGARQSIQQQPRSPSQGKQAIL
jgi:hypothetical protein